MAHPLQNATYETWELCHFDVTSFVNVNIPYSTPTTSSATSTCAFCAGHYLGVAVYILRISLGRVCSLENVRQTKRICMS